MTDGPDIPLPYLAAKVLEPWTFWHANTMRRPEWGDTPFCMKISLVTYFLVAIFFLSGGGREVDHGCK